MMAYRSEDIDAGLIAHFSHLRHPFGKQLSAFLYHFKRKRGMGFGREKSNFIRNSFVFFKQLQEFLKAFFGHPLFRAYPERDGCFFNFRFHFSLLKTFWANQALRYHRRPSWVLHSFDTQPAWFSSFAASLHPEQS